MEAAAGAYNLKLVFAQSNGAFVSEVRVAVKNNNGTLALEAMSHGPLFFARLPPGNYAVEAIYGGIAKQGSASVPANGQNVVHIRW